MAGGAALLVDPCDVGSLAAALGRVLGDAVLRDGMHRKGLAQARRFTSKQTARRAFAVYRELVASSTSAE